MISLVVPAHNEEAVLEHMLRTLLSSAEATGEPFEAIVADDASTDRTADIARSLGAIVVPVNLRNIGAVRNAGARAARGDILIFVDADTLVPRETLAAAISAIRQGAVGGGARVHLEEGVPAWARALLAVVVWAFCRLRWAAGCFFFARSDAFEAAGGFDEAYFASEEIHLSRALKRQGRFVIVREAVVTSNRKARMFSIWHLVKLMARLATRGTAALRRREGLELWYDGQREDKRNKDK
jgi:glycosyltransferase involved in cell wall biosynthesis